MAALSGAAWAQCTPAGIQGPAKVSLINTPFPYASLDPVPGGGLPALPNPSGDEIVRREDIYVSTPLAQKLGIYGAVDADWRNPNPQIRIWIQTPSTFSNWQKRTSGVDTYRNRKSSANFTVVGVVNDPGDRIWVYEQNASNDRESGEYKLFAKDGVTVGGSGTRVPQVQTFPDADADGALDGVVAQALRLAASSRQVNLTGTPSTTTNYCEPDANGSFREFSRRATGLVDNNIIVFAPHGGIIEQGTSEQIAPFRQVIEVTPFFIQATSWDVQGAWGDDQTHRRWHITATNLQESSFPALQAVLPTTFFDPDIDPAEAHPYRAAVAFHGFSSSALEAIIGGQADEDTKCLVVLRTQDRLEAAGLDREEIAYVIHDDNGITDVPNKNNQNVGRRDLGGLSDDNIVNRLAADGGVQIEQSKGLRDNATLRDAMAKGAATALGEVLTGTAPANACSLL
jgi:phage replication-related protein YjqB (UPF0714/DUF867 family)